MCERVKRLEPGCLGVPIYRLEDTSYTNKFVGMCPDKISYTRARGHDLEVILPRKVHHMPDELLTEFLVVIVGQLRMMEDDSPRSDAIPDLGL